MKKYRQLFAGILIILGMGNAARAQNLTAAPFQSFEQLGNSQASWVDVDADGWLDVYLNGKDGSGNTKGRLYQNRQDGSFTEYFINLPAVSGGQLYWTDANGDGLQDVLVTGQKADGSRISTLYRNSGARNFEAWQSFPVLSSGGALWGDWNADGRSDLLLWGIDGSGTVVSKLYAQEGGSFVEQAHNLPAMYRAGAALLDYNRDGRKDIVLSGLDGLGRRISGLYLNEGGFTFGDSQLSFSQLTSPLIAVGDLDADGLPDLLMSGLDINSQNVTHIFLNEGASFAKLPFEPAGIRNGAISLGDLNNDGLTDILLAGYTNSSVYETFYYENRDSRVFEAEALALEAIGRGSLALGDFTHNGSLDLFLTGNRNGSLPPISKLYRNATTPANTAPAAPAGLVAETAHDGLRFSWNAATDGQTPAAGIGYRLYVRTAPGLQDIYASNSLLPSGSSMLAGSGKLLQSAGLQLEGLPEGRYYWSVQAVDNSYATSAFAAEESVVVCHEVSIGEDVTICPQEPLSFHFEAPGDVVNWYSTRRGSLGSGASLEFITAETDTLVVEVVRALGCTRYDSLIVNVLSQPSLNLGADQQLCVGEMLELHVGDSYDSVNWFLPNGDLLVGDSPALSYSITSDVSLIAEVWNAEGCSWRDTLFVEALALPVVDLGADQAICEGNWLELNVGAGYEEVNWYLPNGTSLAQNTPLLNHEVRIDNEIIVEVFNASRCVQYDTLQLTALPRPTVSLGPDREVCQGDTVSLDAGEGYARVNWYFTDGTLLAENAQTLAYGVTDSVSLVVEVFNEVNCPAYDTLQVHSLPRPAVSLGEDQSLCSGEFINLNAGEGYANVNWFLADGTLLQDSTQSISYEITADVQLVAEVWNELGCPAYDTLAAFLLDRPLAILGDDRRICLGETLTLDAGEGYQAVNWFLADGTPVQENSQLLEWNVQGNASLLVEVINSQGCPAYDTLIIEALPLPEISLGEDRGICQGDSLHLNVGDSYSSVNWYLADGSLLAENTPAFHYRIVENMELVVEVFDAESCRNYDTLQIQSLQRPLIDLGEDRALCYGSELTLSLPETYSQIGWYTLSGDTLAEGVFSLDYTVLATDTLWVQVFNEAGCPSADTLIIQMNELPVADAGPDQVFCVGSSLELGGEYASTEGLQFRWEPAAYLSNAAVLHPVATVTETTDFYLTVTDRNGCVQRDTVTLIQDSQTQVNAGADRYICLGESTRLGGEPTATGSTFAYSYEWSPAASLNDPASPNPLASPEESTTYQLITRSGECIVDTAYVRIEVKPLPVITLTEDLTLGFGETTMLQAGGGEVYYWYPQTGLDNYSIPNPMASPEKTTEYHVVVTDSLGCQNEASVMVYVKNDLFIPNTFTPNGDGQNDTFKVYGNGVKEIIFSIYNRWGKLLYQATEVEQAMGQGWDGIINGEMQETGLYQWSIKGQHFDGSPLQFKGNRSGTFKLIR